MARLMKPPNNSSPVSEEKGSVFLQGWFYLGLAGLLGATTGWAIAEPGFVDGAAGHWGNIWLVPLILMLMCVGFGIAESIVNGRCVKLFCVGSWPYRSELSWASCSISWPISFMAWV